MRAVSHLLGLDLHHFLKDLVFGDIRPVFPGHLAVGRRRVHLDVHKRGEAGADFRLSVHFGEDLAQQVEHLGVGRTGEEGIGDSQPGGDGLGALCLARPGRPAEHDVSHGALGAGGLGDMPADLFHLLGDHIPVREDRNHPCFGGGKAAV